MGAGALARSAHFVLHQRRVSTAHGGGVREAAPTLATPAIGVVLPKRWAKRAVTRNLIRRQIYALASEVLCPRAGAAPSLSAAAPLSSAPSFSALPPAHYVVRLRAAFAPAQFVSAASSALRQAVRAELVALFAAATQRGKA